WQFWGVLNEPKADANTIVAGRTDQKIQEKASDKGEQKLEALRISMVTLEPFRSGISATITAQVLEDVKDAQGNIVIPAGSTCGVPFLPFEVGGRITNDSSSKTVIKLPNGAKISIRGVV